MSRARLLVLLAAALLVAIGATWLATTTPEAPSPQSPVPAPELSGRLPTPSPSAPEPEVTPRTLRQRLNEWDHHPPPNVPRGSPALYTYARLVNPDRSHDWIPDANASAEALVAGLLAHPYWFMPSEGKTAYTAIDALREQADAALEVIEPALTEESVLAAVEEGADPSALRRLSIAAVLGTPRGCAIVEERVDDLWGLYGELLPRYIADRSRVPRFVETDQGLAANRTLNMIGTAIRTSVNASKIGSCPDLRAFCRARIEARTHGYLSNCPKYLAWVFPNERLPVIKGPPFWPDPPYWTPAE